MSALALLLFFSASETRCPAVRLNEYQSSFVAEIGVGTIHVGGPVPAATVDASTVELHRRVKDAFDPTGRMNPGRVVA